MKTIGLFGISAGAAIGACGAGAAAQTCEWGSFGRGVPGHATALAVLDENGPAPGGRVLHANHLTLNAMGGFGSRVVRWNGAAWTPLGDDMNRRVNRLTTFDDGAGEALYAGGQFSDIGGVPMRSVARWDGSAWHEVGGGAAFTSTLGVTGAASILALAAADDGGGVALFVGGSFFSSAGGIPVGGIARWNGASWSSMGQGPQAITVLDIAGFDAGTGPAVYVAGMFAQIGGVPVQSVARWNGASWSAVGVLPPGATPAVAGFRALAVVNDGAGPALYMGGPLLNLTQGNHVLKWNGAAWSLVGPGENGVIHALEAFDDGSGAALYATGTFTTAGGVSAAGIARWDGIAWSALGAGVVGDAPDMIGFDDGTAARLVVAGVSVAGGAPVGSIAAWSCDVCYPDCNGDGVLSVADFGCFAGAFVLGQPYADCNGDGLLSIPDFGCFQGRYVVGCP